MEKMTKTALALGGNLGNVKENFAFAVRELKQQGLENIILSGIHHTDPVDCPPGSPAFMNAAVTGFWPGSPLELLRVCQAIEIRAGRPARHEINAPRPLDIDIILFGELKMSDKTLTIPHPRAATRTFVLQPLSEIAPDWIFPGNGRTIRELLVNLI